MKRLSWIAVDWGNTHICAYAIGDSGEALDTAFADCDTAALHPSEFEDRLLAVISSWLYENQVTPVMISGVIGSAKSWSETAYLNVPCTPMDPTATVTIATSDQRILVRVMHGLCQTRPEDVMRGEETRIAGFLSDRPDFKGAVCLPGMHSKWANIAAGQVQSFTTFMTGELFTILSDQSVLRHCTKSLGWDDGVFLRAVESALLDPVSVTAKLFGLRAKALLNGTPHDMLKAELSGLLVGAELVTLRAIWDGPKVAIIGDREITRLYQIALNSRGCSPTVFDATKALIAGLRPLADLPTESSAAA
ncbi:2-dehydro-3-deoxygalactonokinase [Cognatishimia maritima]|uniref:2-dehydro-3-deoxygalactonokinase n=1 Tax=Cognatishimia maritima TaxID=870908 RepID=A0A1M5QHE3_9RHOB|nr:2-dehydro-3-deoxygalactonokinase [Cognatishimia maritima]SHH12943.1 2-dehydro-3-deoxygalactonokinase [Cognatishimia maritima]